MEAIFNDVRKNLARSFNELVEDMDVEGTIKAHEHYLNNIRQDIALLLCMYDDRIKGDCDSLAEVTLSPVFS